MMRLAKAKVLITGLDGLGAEIAKNTILANVAAVTLHDPTIVNIADLGSNFFTTTEDVAARKSRADACVNKMRELNPSVVTSVFDGNLTNDVLSEYSVVVCVDVPMEEACRINDYCRGQRPPIAFLATGVHGLAGYAFADFGHDFPVYDWSGEAMKSSIVSHISKAEHAVISCVFDKDDIRSMHGLEVGDMIELSEVKGMTEINGRVVRVRDVLNPWKFSIDLDTSAFGEYFDGGLINERRQVRVLNFRSLRDALARPGELINVDYSKFGGPAQLHLLLRAIDAFRKANGGRKPAPASAADFDALMGFARAINAASLAALAVEEQELTARSAALEAAITAVKAVPVTAQSASGVSTTLAELEALAKTVRTRSGQLWQEKVEEIDQALFRKLASGASAVLNPMAALFGGFVAQEVVKSVSGKYSPLFQWFHFDAREALANADLPASEFVPANSRYDSQIAVFGRTFVEKLRRQTYFLVGSGALGCEYLKNFALCGVGTLGDAQVIVTDDDVIERSNLSRQFLFRNQHVKQSKSKVAAEAAHAMNPDFNVIALQERAAPNTENHFNDQFWGKLSGVCNALDNVKARLYVDSRCLFYGKSLMESGTLGAKCNTQMILPFMSEHYGAAQDPPEHEAPQCTIHSFPHTIDHCLVWSKSEFTGLFEKGPEEALKLASAGSIAAYVDQLQAASAGQNEILDNLRGDNEWGGGAHEVLARPASNWEDCVIWARNKWFDYVRNRIQQLITLLPEDHLTEKGTRFWAAPKRFPRLLDFDLHDEMTFQFVESAARLRAATFRIRTPAPRAFTVAEAQTIVSKVPVPVFTVNMNAKIETPESKAAAENGAGAAAAARSSGAPYGDDIESASRLFPASSAFAHLRPFADKFEKDEDSNYHIAFVQALGNLRARAYAIPEVDFLKAKLAAGRIIPAIATATAMITGAAMLELYKLVQGHKVEAFRNSFFNLGAMVFSIAEPNPPPRTKSHKEMFKPDPENHPEYEEEKSLKAFPDPFTPWDSIVIDIGDATIGQLAEWFTSKGFDLQSVGCHGAALYMSFSKTAAETRKLKLTDRLRSMLPDVDLSRGYVLIEPVLSTADGDEGLLPTVIYKFAHPCTLDGMRDQTTSLGVVV